MTCVVVIVALATACASHRAEENGADLELIPGRTYTTDEVFPRAAESDLRFEARTTIDPADHAMLHVEVTIANARNARRRIEFQCGCDDVRLRLYASPERTGEPVWDSANRARPDLVDGLPVVCMGTGGVAMLQSRESVSPRNFRVKMKMFEFTKGGLSEGAYYATAEIKLDVPGIVREIPAGTVVLRRP
jgi:hypothetical protein